MYHPQYVQQVKMFNTTVWSFEQFYGLFWRFPVFQQRTFIRSTKNLHDWLIWIYWSKSLGFSLRFLASFQNNSWWPSWYWQGFVLYGISRDEGIARIMCCMRFSFYTGYPLEPIYIQRQRRVWEVAPESVTKQFPSNSKISYSGSHKCSV